MREYSEELKKFDSGFDCKAEEIKASLGQRKTQIGGKVNYVPKSPLDVQIELTTQCNNRCAYCYNFWRYDSGDIKESTLSNEDINIIFGQLRKNDVLRVTLTGGEPFIYPDKVFQCLKLANEYNILADINSNLTLLNEDITKELLKFGSISILTSLISSNEDTHDRIAGVRGAYKKTIENIQRCVEHGFTISVSMVLMQENVADIRSTAKLAKEIGVTTFCATRVTPPLGHPSFNRYALTTEMVKESLNTLLDVGKDYNIETDILNAYPKCVMSGSDDVYKKFSYRNCVAGQTTMTIGSQGEVRPCSNSDISYGNILTEELENIWARMDEWRNKSLLPEFCREKCDLKDECFGGCRISAQYQGDIRMSDQDVCPTPCRNTPKDSPSTEKSGLQLENYQPKGNFIVNPEALFRPESFGGIIYIRKTRDSRAMNRSAFTYLHAIFQNQSRISFSEFVSQSKAIKIEDRLKVNVFFKRLLSKHILLQVN